MEFTLYKEGNVLKKCLQLSYIPLLIYNVWHGGLKEGNVLFNDTLNTFYLWLYGIDNYSARKVTFCYYCLAAKDLYVTFNRIPIMEHWPEQEIAQCVHHEGSIWQPIAPWVDALPWIYRHSLNMESNTMLFNGLNELFQDQSFDNL